MRKFYPGFFFALLVAAPVSLQAQPSTPGVPASQTFTSQDGRFSVLLAGVPKEKTQVLQFKGGGSTTIHVTWVELEDSNITYMVSYNDYPANFAIGDPQSVLANTRDSALAAAKAVLLTDTPTSLNGIPGRAFTASGPKGYHYTLHQYLKGKRLYQLLIISAPGHSATLADLFLSSFQVW